VRAQEYQNQIQRMFVFLEHSFEGPGSSGVWLLSCCFLYVVPNYVIDCTLCSCPGHGFTPSTEKAPSNLLDLFIGRSERFKNIKPTIRKALSTIETLSEGIVNGVTDAVQRQSLTPATRASLNTSRRVSSSVLHPVASADWYRSDGSVAEGPYCFQCTAALSNTW
jgi:hypothetical protein